MFSNGNSFAAAGEVEARIVKTFPWIIRQACPGARAQL